VTYQDDHPDQNGAVSMSGQFNRKGTTVEGRFRVTTKHCGDTGKLIWSAKHKSGA
jgi:carbon monoxide dehydrogenase subunit G